MDGVSHLYSDLSIFVNLVSGFRIRYGGPGGRNEDVHIVEVGPPLAGRVQRFASLIFVNIIPKICDAEQ